MYILYTYIYICFYIYIYIICWLYCIYIQYIIYTLKLHRNQVSEKKNIISNSNGSSFFYLLFKSLLSICSFLLNLKTKRHFLFFNLN